MGELDAASLSIPDRRTRVKVALEERRLAQDFSADAAAQAWEQERFIARARALFYARMMFLTLGLLILAIPSWAAYFGLSGVLPFAGYFAMLLYSVANYLVIGHPRAGRYVTYLTLCADVAMMVVVVSKPQVGGGLRNPLLATQLLFTTLFAILFPRPLAILPSLLALPITTRLDQILNREDTGLQLLTVLWYSALNFIIVYVVVYLNEREAAAQREVVQLQADLKELAVVEERNRLAREIHDGLGASLSSLIIQAEYLMQLAKDDRIRAEIAELKGSAEESIEELRRSLRMMREDFELSTSLEDYVRTFRDRTQLKVGFEKSGAPAKLSQDVQLTLFRVLQEALANAAKHADAHAISVKLAYESNRVLLSVQDDGRGFDAAQVPPGHYGVRNMHERAIKLGGELTLISKPGQGTQVLLSVPGHA